MGDLSQMLPIVLLFGVMYFFLIRPSMQKQKKERKYVAEIKTGDKVVTKSGMHGKILSLNDDGTCIIESGAGKMKFERSSLSMEMSVKLNDNKLIKK
ncbi:preprotein translocase subunit YajC [Patiriisocius sp. Uisw_017]|jgi:preprotein translocase subunit YajC|uniref:preprotein translocase subunit YajC n=1 Tax=Patiriisocius sp. Uisw_017 TaxID=3230968 RepID=UPI0039EA97EA